MSVGSEFGPLAALAGTWEGEKGLDVAYSNERDKVADTPFRERAVFNPFGPVDNGSQHLYGLDYRMSGWRGDEVNPFHTEVGYWLWDAADRQLMRCFMVPRGVVLIAGATVEPDATTFTLRAELGSPIYGILSNPYLDELARTIRYEVTVTLDGDTYSYEETTLLDHRKVSEPLVHTDRNTLYRTE